MGFPWYAWLTAVQSGDIAPLALAIFLTALRYFIGLYLIMTCRCEPREVLDREIT